MARKFYTAQDRPALGTLVHNLEHGYTILWYDDTVAKDSDQMDQIRAIADKFAGTTDLRDKFKAVPWTADDGKAFPDGQHIAFTHWSVGGTQNAAPARQAGRRLAVLLRRLRRRAQDLHDRLPVTATPPSPNGV